MVRRGERFHRLVERTEHGMDADQVAVQAQGDEDLERWYAAYRHHRPANLPAPPEIEQLLSVTMAVEAAGAVQPVRLAAKYDLIAAEKDGPVIIIDWKTGKRPPPRFALQEKLQTLVYPFVLVEAAAPLAWGPVRPEQVEMRYWLTAAPAAPISFRYDGAQHDRARRLLHQQIATILSGENEADFPKVEDTPANRKRFCNFCVYRSRCNRGVNAGDVGELTDPTDYFSGDVAGSLEFTMDEVEELAF